MGFGLNDIFSCFCRDNSDDCCGHKDCKEKGNKDNNIFMWILIIVVFFCCSFRGFVSENSCCDPCAPKKGNNIWIIVVILLICICNKDGFGDLGGLGIAPNGNLNTNIINLDREDYCDDDC